MLKSWTSVCGIIGNYRTFRKWELVVRSKGSGGTLLRMILEPCPFLSLSLCFFPPDDDCIEISVSYHVFLSFYVVPCKMSKCIKNIM